MAREENANDPLEPIVNKANEWASKHGKRYSNQDLTVCAMIYFMHKETGFPLEGLSTAQYYYKEGEEIVTGKVEMLHIGFVVDRIVEEKPE